MRLVIMENGVAGIMTTNPVRRVRPDVDIVIYSQDWHEKKAMRGILGQRVMGFEPNEGHPMRVASPSPR